MRAAISKFQGKEQITPTGEATEHVLTRLRKMDDLRPWALDRLQPGRRQMGNVVEPRVAPGRGRRCLRTVVAPANAPRNRASTAKRCGRVRSIRQVLLAGPARHRGACQGEAALYECARLANLAASLALFCADGSGRQNLYPVLGHQGDDAEHHSSSHSACQGCWVACSLLGVSARVSSVHPPRRAQSGSAGGSIGNDEKSLSGSRASPRAAEPEKPARRSKPEAEEPRRSSSRRRRRRRRQFRRRVDRPRASAVTCQGATPATRSSSPAARSSANTAQRDRQPERSGRQRDRAAAAASR